MTTLAAAARSTVTWLESAVQQLDPRTVKLRDTRRLPGWATVLAGVAVFVVAATLALSDPPDELPAALPPDPLQRPAEGIPELEPTLPAAAPRPETTHEQRETAHHPRYHDPFYVFTEGEVNEVSAYAMVDPPGVVVDLVGSPEPSVLAAEMVGKDERIRAVRRRTTPRGLRYVIAVTFPIKRLEVVHEGQVVMILPLE